MKVKNGAQEFSCLNDPSCQKVTSILDLKVMNWSISILKVNNKSSLNYFKIYQMPRIIWFDVVMFKTSWSSEQGGRMSTYVVNGHCTRSQCYRQSSSITTRVSVTFFSAPASWAFIESLNDDFVLLFIASSFKQLPLYYKLVFDYFYTHYVTNYLFSTQNMLNIY